MIRKIVALALAIVVNCAVLFAFNSQSVIPATGNAQSSRAASAPTLPVITVRPTPAEIRMLRPTTTEPRRTQQPGNGAA